MRSLFRPVLVAVAFTALGMGPVSAAERIVSVGGALTEIVYALGEGDSLVGVDTTSRYPAEAAALPQVGYNRQISAEGVLSLAPTLVLLTEEAGPPAAIRQIADSGVRVVVLPAGDTPEVVGRRVEGVAEALGEPRRGAQLRERIDDALGRLRTALAGARERPRVLVLLAVGQGAPLAGGRNTAADAMVGLAGGTNVVDQYQGYKPLTPEAAVVLDPQVIVVPDHALQALGGTAALAALPGLRDTTAVRQGRIVPVDSLAFLGLGPRIAVAARHLAGELHPGLPLPELAAP
jgi:iron complex transport system substrate-binding protein